MDNQAYLSILSRYLDVFEKKDGPFKHKKISKAINLLASYKVPINLEELEENDFPKNVINLLKEFQQSGKIQHLEEEINSLPHKLMQIYGIGLVKAKELIKSGVTSIEDLKEKTHLLNDIQKIGLKYNDSIQKRIPRNEIQQYKDLFENIFKKQAYKDSCFEIVGSFRRGASDSGDIDLILTNNSNNNNVLNVFLDELIESKIIIEVLSRGKVKSLTIGKLPGLNEYRRIDFLYCPYVEYPYAMLYFTGSKWFNTAMRQRALDCGYSLNEHGFTNKANGNKIEIKINSEEDIFKFLNMNYKIPHERKDFHSVEIIEDDTKHMININIEYLQKYKKEGLDFLQTLKISQMEDVIKYATQEYSLGKPLLSDEEFDIMKEYLESIQPTNKILLEIGSEVTREKVKLSYFMPSMDKIKPNTPALQNYIKKYEKDFVVSAKLDGISALYCTNPLYLHTRGNGSVGQNISYLIPYLNLPKLKSKCVIRGEIIISKEVFKQFANEFANPRNLTAGIVSSIKEENEDKYKYLDFVGYELIEPKLIPLEQMKFLKNAKFNVVKHEYFQHISNDLLSGILDNWKESYKYEIDGIIVTHDKIYERENKNPKHSVAYKKNYNENMKEVEVIDVLWNASKDKYLKPRLKINQIDLNGSMVSYVTGFNGKYIYNNKIGPGSTIKIGLSGGVIPHIFEVTKCTEPKMPVDDYTWSENEVDIILVNGDENETVIKKLMLRFFQILEVDGVKEGTIKQLFDAGYNSISKVLSMEKDDFNKINGFGKKKTEKIYNSIKEKLNSISLVELMCASNTFGRGMGEKKLHLILENYPNILTSTECNEDKLNKVSKLKGLSEKTSHLFVDYIDVFIAFLKEANLLNKLNETKQVNVKDTTHPLYNKEIVMSGFRDKDLITKLLNVGSIQGSNVTKKTFVLLVTQEENTTKVQTARDLNVPIMNVNQFTSQYNL